MKRNREGQLKERRWAGGEVALLHCDLVYQFADSQNKNSINLTLRTDVFKVIKTKKVYTQDINVNAINIDFAKMQLKVVYKDTKPNGCYRKKTNQKDFI